MATQKIVTAPAEGQNLGRAPAATVQPLPTNQVDAIVGVSIDQLRGEVDDAFADMKTFLNRNPDEIMRMARGHSARLSELRVRIMRMEDFNSRWKSARTREVEPCLDELREQYLCASRLEAVRELDWRIESGGT